MGAANGDDMEDLLAQIEREYEEEENRQKKEKKSKKKGGKQEAKTDVTEPAEDERPDEKLVEKNENIQKTEPQKKAKGKIKKKEKDEEEVVTQKEKENLKAKEDKVEAQEEKKAPAKEAEAKKKAKKPEKADAKQAEAESKKPADVKAQAADLEAQEEAVEAQGKGKKKKPSGALKTIKEALAKQKEIEEEIRRQEDEKIRKEEELRLKLLEQERLEKERKEKKKLKEKQRIERLKQEGKYLTKAQKESKERAFRQLEALGVQIPQKTDKPDEAAVAVAVEEKHRKPKYEKLKKTKQQLIDEAANEKKEVEHEELKVGDEAQPQTTTHVSEVKECWDDESDEEVESKQIHETKGSHKTRTDETSESEEESEDETTTESESEDEDLSAIEKAKIRLEKIHEEAEKLRSVDKLREPVICVLGHVDTGKTKLLDNLRRTRVQEDEVGGITQQIGATNVPFETIQERTKMCRHVYKENLRVPGLLIIDTPGHEAFKGLRSRGSSLCDIAILVIDIMHGLEPQTIESIEILREKKTPFVVALNKIDRLFEWKTFPHLDIEEVLKKQATNTRLEFEKRSKDIILQLNEKGLNAALCFQNPDPRTYFSLVPTSAHSSDGVGNLIALLAEFCQTILAKRISYSNELQCSVLEVKVIPSLGTTIDVCLVNGKLKVCDTIVVAGQEGPIVTQIRGLLMPQPNRELRVKSAYTTHKEILGARGVKIAAKGLDKAMAGLPLFVASKEDEIEYYKDELQKLLKNVLSSIKLSDLGVFVHASTLGSLEALLEFLKTSKIPYAGIGIGPVHKKDVTRTSVMLEKDKQWAVILAFDVRIEREAQDLADHLGVNIFYADIIYHLFDKFMGFRDELKRKKREEFKDVAVFPCKLKIIPEFIFNTRDPIVVGVKIEAGFIKIGSPIVALCENENEERESKEKFVDLGRITSIEFNHKPLEVAKQGQEVCIKIDNTTGGAPKLLGRHFTQTDLLISKISRESIDAVKDYFREEMTKADWQLIIELKKLFQII